MTKTKIKTKTNFSQAKEHKAKMWKGQKENTGRLWRFEYLGCILLWEHPEPLSDSGQDEEEEVRRWRRSPEKNLISVKFRFFAIYQSTPGPPNPESGSETSERSGPCGEFLSYQRRLNSMQSSKRGIGYSWKCNGIVVQHAHLWQENVPIPDVSHVLNVPK